MSALVLLACAKMLAGYAFDGAGVHRHAELVHGADVEVELMRPAGVLIPTEAGREQLQAGFGQIEAQVIKVGMAAEATCASKPLIVQREEM
jgi:hypothetical protein